jgi:methionine-S-sulfoxide reductase
VATLLLSIALGGTVVVLPASPVVSLSVNEGGSVTAVDQNALYAEKTATFALGCFWGAEALFGGLHGVVRTRVGYAGGVREAPSYDDIGDHAEAVEVVFHPSVISYDELLAVFWGGHDAYRNALNPQYRSMILVHDERQRIAAETSYAAQVALSGRTPTTSIAEAGGFTPAEDGHQKFRVQSKPALAELLLARYDSFAEFVDSTLVTRVNSVLGREVAVDEVSGELIALGLTEEELLLVRRAIGATCKPPRAGAFDPAARAAPAEEDGTACRRSCTLAESES